MLPESFITMLRASFSEEEVDRLTRALATEPAVSVRRNPAKLDENAFEAHFSACSDGPVPWAEKEAIYLDPRPSFTLDPLFHAGGYYVQEAASMYVATLLERAFPDPDSQSLRVLDLCAAPGGKSTHLLARLGPDALLVANETVRQRAGILAENLSRWGSANCVVTTNDPADFGALTGYFDLLLVDAPCSGEGMFRKDATALAEWSPDAVRLCAARQKRILADSWPTLRPGGWLIYSTCTFNREEDEENARWICETLGGSLLEMRHFLPGRERGEGFFCALIQKEGSAQRSGLRTAPVRSNGSDVLREATRWVRPGHQLLTKISREGTPLIKAFPASLAAEMTALESRLKVIHSGVAVATVKGRDLIPEADLALSPVFAPETFPRVELDRDDALAYLSHAPFLPQGQPKGYLTLCYKELPLGFVKHLGNRCNTLHPLSRRIRMEIPAGDTELLL